jgi:5-methylcytosine-specific restriction endonuclease McrA
MERPERYSRRVVSASFSTVEQEKRKKFYQQKEWKVFRKKMLTIADRKDLAEVRSLWVSGAIGKNIHEYNAFMSMKPFKPYCRRCAKNGELMTANVLDHIKAMEDGGKPYDRDNVQWLCYKCHAQKSVEDRSGRDE